MRKRLDHLEENVDKWPPAVKDRLRALREDFQQSQPDKVLSDVEAYQRQHGRLPARQREANEQDLLAKRLARLQEKSSTLSPSQQRRLSELLSTESAPATGQDSPRTKRLERLNSNCVEEGAG